MTTGSVTRISALVCLCALLGGCGGMGVTELTSVDYGYARGHATPATPEEALPFPDQDADVAPAPSTVEGTGLQCVPYAREHSGIDIHGDAYTWWDKAAGLYVRGDTPLEGSVMVMVGYAGRHRAHVAIVRHIVSSRKILIDHANWLDDGAIYVNDPVEDVSADNDWSQIKVWNIRTGSWGTKTYNVRGFIGPGKPDGSAVVASYRAPERDDPIARKIAATGDDLDDSGDDR
jgi:surface antigen